MAEIYYLWGTYNHNDEGTYYETIGFYSTEALALEARANFITEELEGGLENNPHVRLRLLTGKFDINYLEAQADE